MQARIRNLQGMEIRKATSAEVIAQTELLKGYTEECSLPEIGPIDPQGKMYAAMEEAGVNQFFGAYQSGMIGFASVLVCVLPHYGKPVATVESLYVSPDHRESPAGRSLMTAVEQYAKERGCVAILYSAPAGGKLDKLLTLKKDYRQTNTVFCRRLTAEP